ncbi:tripartite motif-containing protein 3-like [Haliotis asinina]|uniref:tripartite motif-containing protein 3-like n=1 Tax=Haliotis asinina TaxID=109174 RepID=UPI0035325A6F
MAEQHLIESHFHCPICKNVFDRPKAIPCLHTFCLDCLESYVARNGNDGRFPCPVCRQTIYIPSGGVWSFPDNDLILHLRVREAASVPYGNGEMATLPVDQPPTYQTLYGDKAFDWETSDVFVVNNLQSMAVFINKFAGHGTGPEDFTHVSGLAVNPLNDNIIVTDCSLNKVAIFNVKGDFISSFYTDCSIRDVCVTNFNTLLVSVSRSGSALLREYTMDGQLIAAFGSFYKYDNPCGISLDITQKVVVTSLEKNTVHVLTDQKKPCTNFGSKGSGHNHFIQPSYVTVNHRNEIVVSDTGNHRIKIHEMNGQFIRQIGSQGHVYGQLFYPMGLCIDRCDNIYVADANNYRVQVFTAEGDFLACPVQKTFEVGVDVKPTNVVISRNRLVVALRGSRQSEVRLYKWDVPLLHVKSSTYQLGSACCLFTCCIKSDYEEI